MKRLTILFTVFILFSLESQKAQANLTDGLIAHYIFSGNANDVSGNGHNGTVYGASLTSDRFGNPNSAYEFDGINDYISVNYHADFQLPTYAISAWIKPAFDETTLTSRAVFVSRGEDFSTDNAALSFGIGEENSIWGVGISLLYEDNGDVECLYDTGIYPQEDEWSHLALTRATDGVLSIYLNGGLLDSWNSTPIPTSQCFQDLTIGAYWFRPTISNRYLTDFFTGSIDDVLIYNRALSESEINSLSVIPVPSAILLGSIGIGALNWLRRRKII